MWARVRTLIWNSHEMPCTPVGRHLVSMCQSGPVEAKFKGLNISSRPSQRKRAKIHETCNVQQNRGPTRISQHDLY